MALADRIDISVAAREQALAGEKARLKRQLAEKSEELDVTKKPRCTLSAMFAVAMSSMDSALNRNSRILVKRVYESYFCQDGDDNKLMLAGKVFTAMCGLIVIDAGLLLTILQEFSLFDAMILVGTLVGFPH